MAKAVLYIITEQEAGEKEGWFKLGVTNNTDRRLAEHQTSNPRTLSYHKLYNFPSSQLADIVELSLLKKLPHQDYCRDYRSEWFLVEDVTEMEKTVEKAVNKLKQLIHQFNRYVIEEL